MTTSVSTMILRSLRLLGEKGRGDTLTSDEQAECLGSLNAMMESWSLNRLMCYQVSQESFPLVASQGTYTIGPGGNFDTTRPTKIVDPCFIRDAANLDSSLKLIDAVAYGRIVQKSVDGTYPNCLFYDQGYASGLGSISLYPEPAANLTLFINSWKQLQTFASVSTVVALPPGYERAIVYNYAIEEAGGYGQVPVEVAKIARDSLASIKSLNLPDSFLRMDAGIVKSYSSNILTGP